MNLVNSGTHRIIVVSLAGRARRRAGILLLPYITILATLFWSAAFAQTHTPTIAEINTLSGLNHVLESMDSSFTTLPPEVEAAHGEELKDAWAIASEGVFDASAMLTVINVELADKFSAAELAELHGFYESAYGRAIVALEIAAADEERREEIDAEGRRILAEIRIKDPERLALYEEMINDTGAMEFAEAAAMNAAYALLAGMCAQSPVAPSEELLTQLLQGQRAEIRREVQKAVLETFAYSYSTLTMSEVRPYAQFLATDIARRYYAETFHILGNSISDAAKTFGQRLAVALGQRKA